MRKIDALLVEYGESHTNPVNKRFHWVCIPVIMFSLMGLLMAIPMPFELPVYVNWATVFMFFALLYYIKLSFKIFIGFLPIVWMMLWGNIKILETYGSEKLVIISLILFVVAWIGQFIGHNIEGKKPSFFKDLQFLLIGPAWLLHFIYKKAGIIY